jgi:hypothetical protein
MPLAIRPAPDPGGNLDVDDILLAATGAPDELGQRAQVGAVVEPHLIKAL